MLQRDLMEIVILRFSGTKFSGCKVQDYLYLNAPMNTETDSHPISPRPMNQGKTFTLFSHFTSAF